MRKAKGGQLRRPLSFLGSVAALAAGLALATPPAAAADGSAGPYLAARQALGANSFAEAADYLERLLQAYPDNAQALENAVVAHLALGDLDAAHPRALRLADLGVNSQPARLVRIGHLLHAGDWAAALEALEGGQGMGLVDQLLRGWTHLATGRMSDALAEFQALGENQATRAFGLYHQALALAAAGDAEGAEAILSGAAAGPLQLTRRGVLARAQILGQLERPDTALELLDTHFGPDPEVDALRDTLAAGDIPAFDIVATARDGMAEVFFDVASALQGDAGDSFILLLARMSVALRPDHGPATLLTAGLLDALDQHELAVAAFAAVGPEAPLFHLAEMGRAEALSRAGDPDTARAVLEALAESHGHLAVVHTQLGDLLRRERDFDAASRAYDRAIALLGDPQPQHWVVYYTRAITHEREDRWPQAEADFRQALELNPDQPHVLNYLGYSLVERRENLDEALEMIERAVAGEPDNGYIVDSLGWVFYRLGRYDEALIHMERAVELMPTDAILNDHLGDVYYALGRKREARFQWRRALSFGPADDLDMDRIRRKLEVGLDAVLIEEGAEPHHADASHGN